MGSTRTENAAVPNVGLLQKIVDVHILSDGLPVGACVVLLACARAVAQPLSLCAFSVLMIAGGLGLHDASWGFNPLCFFSGNEISHEEVSFHEESIRQRTSAVG